MTRKTKFKYFHISRGYGEGSLDYTGAFLTEEGVILLDQILNEQAKKTKSESSSTWVFVLNVNTQYDFGYGVMLMERIVIVFVIHKAVMNW